MAARWKAGGEFEYHLSVSSIRNKTHSRVLYFSYTWQPGNDYSFQFSNE